MEYLPQLKIKLQMLQSLKKENLAMCSIGDGLGAIKWSQQLGERQYHDFTHAQY